MTEAPAVLPVPAAPATSAPAPPRPQVPITRLPQPVFHQPVNEHLEPLEYLARRQRVPSPPLLTPSPEPEIRPKNVIPKRQITLARKPTPENEEDKEDECNDPFDEQWRVGKTPGHQGSHKRAKRRAETLDGDEVS